MNMAASVITTPQTLAQYRRLVLFGGSFDPPHQAHVTLPRYVRQQLEADRVVYVPAAQSPHKLARQPTPATHRLAMLEAALADTNDALILTTELDRGEAGDPSYTVDTLAQVRQSISDQTKLYLLIGADQVPVFEQWHKADRIAELAEPIAMVRPPARRDSLLGSLSAAQQQRWDARIMEVPAMDLSATDVRQRVAAGEPIADLVPTGVARYIKDHALYQI